MKLDGELRRSKPSPSTQQIIENSYAISKFREMALELLPSLFHLACEVRRSTFRVVAGF